MPKFHPKEREHLHQALLTQGEQLFGARGLKKVSLEDLTAGVGIAKASFYSFFPSKEELFLQIAMDRQQEIFLALEAVLEGNRMLPARQRVRKVFQEMARLQTASPILQSITPEVVRVLHLRVPADKMLAFRQSNLQAVLRMQSHGIRFTCDPATTSAVFLALYGSWLQLMAQAPELAPQAIDILLEGALQQIILPD